jgi:hypothetical protein
MIEASFVYDTYCKFRAEKLTEPATYAFVLVNRNRRIVPLLVDLVRGLEDILGAEVSADLAALAKVFVDIYHGASPQSTNNR